MVRANNYNPNSVAAPEMRLLELSISADGFTQPIVTWQCDDGWFEVVDGFHRHLIGKKLGFSHLPVVIINPDRADKGDRIASTIRHNRARGKHAVNAMSEIVVDLARRNWSEEKIARELGMDADEVLRLKQISGLAEMFSDREFSEAWEVQ
jgi:ParB-like chromosome segregation protein Spo0J